MILFFGMFLHTESERAEHATTVAFYGAIAAKSLSISDRTAKSLIHRAIFANGMSGAVVDADMALRRTIVLAQSIRRQIDV